MTILSCSYREDIPANPQVFLVAFRQGFFPFAATSFFTERFPMSNMGLSTCRPGIPIKDVELFVFWTKNLAPLLPALQEIRSVAPVLIHFTITGYDAPLEPGLPLLEDRLEAFHAASEIVGSESIIWRFDPIILFPEENNPLDGPEGCSRKGTLGRFSRLGKRLAGHTERVVFSFLSSDYPKVNARFQKLFGMLPRFPPKERPTTLFEPWADGDMLKSMVDIAGSYGMELHSCGHGQDFSPYGVKASACIDPNLAASLVPALAEKQNKAKLRKGCGCLASQDIGIYGRCNAGCLYCYASR